jgi:2-polyprenyl-3-methyl-5-hydroxy-6-metoxy-1,4-benzoquinol methylase
LFDYSRRSREAELLDDAALDGDELARTLDELETINRLLGGHAASFAGLEELLPATPRSLSVLDVGTGCGDFPRRVSAWARRRGIEVRVRGIDLSAATVAHARARSRELAALEFEQADALALPADQCFDVVHAGMVLHHLEGERAVEFLRRLYGAARLGVVVNDIHRHPLAYHSIRLLTRALSRSRLVRNDAPVSVLRAFRRHELEALATAAGLPRPRIAWRWAFRWVMVVRR